MVIAAVIASTAPAAAFAGSGGPFYLRFSAEAGAAEDRASTIRTIANAYRALPRTRIVLCHTVSTSPDRARRTGEIRRSLIAQGIPTARITIARACTGASAPRDTIIAVLASGAASTKTPNPANPHHDRDPRSD